MHAVYDCQFSCIYISQGSVATQLMCGEIFNTHIIANCLQSVSVEKNWKLVNNWRRYGQKQSGTFLWPTVHIIFYMSRGRRLPLLRHL